MVPPPDYLPRLREICDQHNVVLIYDEIITGFGRLGAMFGSEYFNAPPDITACGKGMSGGYAPLAAILVRERIARAFYGTEEDNVQFHHGHTYAGNPVASAAGVAALTQLVERDLVGNARRQGERLRQRLTELAERYALIGDVRGAGLLQGVEFVADRKRRTRFPKGVKPGKVVEREARARGMLLRCGNDFVVFAPPLVVTPAEIDEMTGILGECIAIAQREALAAAG
jgi:adenosylmethionine-8-amino-7-oxononanoate aminotransferase